MYWMTKVTWSELIVLAAIAKVRHKEGDTVGDAITIASATVSVGAIWYPEIRATIVAAALATPLAPAAAAAASAYAIGGVIAYAAAPEGEEAEALVDYYHDPLGTTYDIISKEVTETAQQIESIATGVVRFGIRAIEREYEEKKMQAKAVWDFFGENRYSNPFGLPF